MGSEVLHKAKKVVQAAALAALAAGCANEDPAEALQESAPDAPLIRAPEIHRYYSIRCNENGAPIMEHREYENSLEAQLYLDELLITVPESGKGSFPAPKEHVISAGDTYGEIAQAEYGDSGWWNEIQRCTVEKVGESNADPGRLQIGDTIYIPSREEIEALRLAQENLARLEKLKNLPRHESTIDNDSLPAIAARGLGDARYWTVLAALNPGVEFFPESGEQIRIRPDFGTLIIAPAAQVDRLWNREIDPVLLRFPDRASEQRRAFVAECAPYACDVERYFGIPAELVLAQAAWESGWGEDAPGNNHFGIKADSRWSGESALAWTHEELAGGKSVPLQDDFRAYPSTRDSFLDLGVFLCVNPRYEKVFHCLDDPAAAVRALREAGYATDSTYVSDLCGMLDLFTSDPSQIRIDTPEREGFEIYEIQPGDTFRKIAKVRLGATKHWPMIQSANLGVNPKNLQVGARIYIPTDR